MSKLTINTQALKDFEKRLNKVLKTIPSVMGQAAVTHFQENITKRQGLPKGGSLQRFKGRVFDSNRQRSRGVLNDTGNLVDSIKVIRLSGNHVEVGIRKTEMPYAEIHQRGGQVHITEKMRKFFWAKHYEFSSPTQGKRGRKATSTRDEANFWKAMALKRRGSTINIPARPFMDITPDLEKTILRAIQTEMNHII